MTKQGAEPYTIRIVERLFNFIKDNFDGFDHRKGNWWNNHSYGKDRGIRGESWAPFVEACFVLEGENTSFKVGHCYGNDTHNVENFINDYRNLINLIEPPYDHSIHPCDSSSRGGGDGIDVSWRTEDNIYFLALEHSENRHPNDIDKNSSRGFCSKFNKGETENNAQLRGICDEIYKLNEKHSTYNILVSRPHIRYKDNKIYNNVVDHFKKNIENILLHINPINEWTIILITPESHIIDNPIQPMKIRFHCYQWMNCRLEDIPLQENSFFVRSDENGPVKICTPTP